MPPAIRRKHFASQRRRRSVLSRRRQRLLQKGFENLESRQLLAIDFQITYANDGVIGFNHPTLGQARRDALEAKAAEYGSWFNHTATIDIEATNTNVGILRAFGDAQFADSFPDSGFDRRVPEQKILNGGVDPNGSVVDATLNFNWEDSNPTAAFVWELGDDVESPTEADFQAAVVHELTHILGFSTGIDEDGGDTFEPPTTPGQPGLWNVYDQFVSTSDGVSIINNTTFALNTAAWSGASTSGTAPDQGLFFNGPNAMAAYGNRPVPLHSPSTFLEGSSVSHVRINDTDPDKITDATHLMLWQIRDGKVARQLNPLEVAVMKDLGYDMALPPPAIIVAPTDGSNMVSENGSTDSFDVSLAVRPPTNVFVQITSADTDEVVVDTPFLMFTPVNWNIPQFVDVHGVDDTDVDFDQTTLIMIAVENPPVSDPLYTNVSIDVPVTTVDNEPHPGELALQVISPLEENSGNSKFTVNRNNGVDGVVTVDYVVTPSGISPADAADFDGGFPGGTITFGDGESSKEVLLPVKFDTNVEPDEGFTVTLSNATGGALISAATRNGQIANDDRVSIVMGNAGSAPPVAKVVQNNEFSFTPFASDFAGGVSVASGDIDGDGTADIITGTGPGATSQVKVFSGTNGEVFLDFFPYADFSGGVNVAVADINGDGKADIITGAGPGAGPHVKVFSGADGSVLASFFAYTPSFSGGVTVAGGDVNGDGRADIITAMGPSGTPEVRAFSGVDLGMMTSFFAYPSNFLGGVTVAAGDLDGDGAAEIITGMRSSGLPEIKAFSGAIGALLHDFFAFSGGFLGGVNVAAGDVNGDGRSDIIAGMASGGSQVRAFSGVDSTPLLDVDALLGNDGVFVAAANNPLVADNRTSLTLNVESITASKFGEDFAITATINHLLVGTPTGKVHFKLESLASPIEVDVDVDANGVASLSVSTLDVATYLVTAQYTGNAVFAASPERFGSHTIEKADTTVDLVSSGSPSFAGDSVTFTATVSAAAPGAGIPTGVVFFEDADTNTLLDTIPLVGGQATISGVFNVAGTFHIRATYDGDAHFNAQIDTETQLVLPPDSDPPTPVITSMETSPTKASPFPVDISFGEPVNGFDQTDLVVVGGTVSTFTDVGGGFYFFDITPNNSATPITITVDIAAGVAADLAGNDNLAATQFSIVSDRVAPKPTISTTASARTNLALIPIDFDFGEPVTDFDAGDINISSGTLLNFDNLGAGKFAVDIQPAADGLITVDIAADKAVDLAGNKNLAATQFSITSDRSAPTPAISSAETSPTNAALIPVSVDFGESMTNFIASDLTVTGGTVGDFADAGSGKFTFKVTPTATTITVNIAANKAADVAGNNNLAATPFTITSDRTAPTPVISSSAFNGTNLLVIPIAVNFGEPVDGFDAPELAVSGGTISNFAPGPNGKFTFDVTTAGTGPITVDIAAGVAEDAAHNPNLAATQFTIDSAPPPDLELTLLSPPTTADAGSSAIYALLIKNLGIGDVDGSVIMGTFPAGLSLDAANSSPGVEVNGQDFMLDVGALPAGESTLRTISARLLSTLAAGATKVLQFTIDAISPAETALANNTASVTTTVERKSDVSVTVTDGPDPAPVGQSLTHTVRVTNQGPSNANNVVVTVTLPSGVTVVSANSTAGGTINGQSISYAITSLATSKYMVFTIASTIAGNRTLGDITTVASVTQTETDPFTPNNTASTVTKLIAANGQPAPDANDDALNGTENQNLEIPTESLLEDDLNVQMFNGIVALPVNGTVGFNPQTHALTYTPNPDFSGTDSFQYAVEALTDERLVMEITTVNGVSSQIVVDNAAWNMSDTFVGDFAFSGRLNQASPAVLSALTSGNVVPRVKLFSRSVRDLNSSDTVETLRWTLHDVQFKGYAVSDSGAELGNESYVASFKKVELDVARYQDVADQRDEVASRFHTGRDLVANRSFDSQQFFSQSPAYSLTPQDIDRQSGSDFLLAVGGQGGLSVDLISFGISNNASLATPQPPLNSQVSEVAVQFTDSQSAVAFLDASLTGAELGDVVITRGLNDQNHPGVVEATWTLRSAKVKSFSTSVTTDGNAYQVALGFDDLVLAQTKFDGAGEPDGELAATRAKNGTVSGDRTFGDTDIETEDAVERYVETPSGDFEVFSVSITANPDQQGFSFPSITFTSSGMASTGLFAGAASGDLIPTMKLFTRRIVEGEIESLETWKFTNARISSYQESVEPQGARSESFSIIAASLERTIETFDPDSVTTFDQVNHTTTPSTASFLNHNSGDVNILKIGNAEFDIGAFQWSPSRNGNAVDVGEISVRLTPGRFDPALLRALTTGATIPTVRIIRRFDDGPSQDIKNDWILSNVQLSHYSEVYDQFAYPTESFGLTFTKVEAKVLLPEDVYASAGFDTTTSQASASRIPRFNADNHDELRDGLFVRATNNNQDQGAIELDSLSLSMFQLGGNGLPAVQLAVSISSAKLNLLDAMFRGDAFDALTVTKVEDGHVFETWKLSNARIVSVGVSRESASDQQEMFVVEYDKLDVTHRPRLEDGTAGNPITSSIDAIANKIIGANEFGTERLDRESPQDMVVDFGAGSAMFNVMDSSWATSINSVDHLAESSQFQFRMPVGSTMPGLFASVAEGTVLPQVLVKEFARRPGNSDTFEHSRWTLDNAKLSSVLMVVQADSDPTLTFTLDLEVVSQDLRFAQSDGTILPVEISSFNYETHQPVRISQFTEIERILADIAQVVILVEPEFVDVDLDSVDDRIEGNAPHSGDGNNDGTQDNAQNNVTSLPHPASGKYVTLGAPAGQPLSNVSIQVPSVTPPADIDFRVGLLQYELQNAPANSGETTITIYVDQVNGFNSYYKFGPTASNPTPHYYRFLYDSAKGVGAKIFADRIELHLKDGLLGDDDLQVNGKIVDPGAPTINSAAFPYQNPDSQLDVDDDGNIAPIDALLVINELNSVGSHALASVLPLPIEKYFFFDVDADAFVAPQDALQVINFLNAPAGGEGEGEDARSLTLAKERSADQAFAGFGGALGSNTLPAKSTAEQSMSRRSQALAEQSARALPCTTAAKPISSSEPSRRVAAKKPCDSLVDAVRDEIFAALGRQGVV